MGSEIGVILQYAGTHGPFLAVIIFLLRSSARKDDIIENLSAQALRMVQESRAMTSLVRETLQPPNG